MGKQNVLITGISGQDGVFLANKLINEFSKKIKIYGISRQNPSATLNKIYSLGTKVQNLEILNIDLENSATVLDIIEKIQPTQIYNLSGPSSVYDSLKNPKIFSQTINLIFNNLTNACLKLKLLPNFFQACSSEMFSSSNAMPLNEKSNFSPRSPYAQAKYEVFNKVNDLKERHNWNINSGIMFNHESEFRNKNYLFTKIFESAKLIKQKKLDYLEVGSLDLRRDWSFAGDIANAIYLINQSEIKSNFVIGSGKAFSINELIQKVFYLYGIDFDSHIKINSALLRPGDPKFMVSDPTLIKQTLNWKNEYSLDDLIERIFSKIN